MPAFFIRVDDGLSSGGCERMIFTMHALANLFNQAAGGQPGVESIESLLDHPAFTLEHIVSRGAASPEGFWYDSPRAEWVVLLRGTASLRMAADEVISLTAGDPVLIPAHCRHRVEETSHDAVWLALHFTAHEA